MSAKEHSLQDGTQLTRPDDTTVLMERMVELAGLRLATIVDRAELAGICTLLKEGTVTNDQVWQMLLKFYHFAPAADDTSEWLQPVRYDYVTTQLRLTSLVAEGRPDNTPGNVQNLATSHYGDPTPTETQAARWMQDIMRMVDTIVGPYVPNVPPIDWVADQLPDALRNEVRSDAAREWFGSVCAIGEAMHGRGANGCGAFSMGTQSMYVADALAQAVLAAINDHQSATVDEDAVLALGRIELFWALLKGFTFGAVSAPLSRLTAMLGSNAAIVERIDRALQAGLEVLKGTDAAAHRWGSKDRAGSEHITTDELLRKLRERIDQEREEAESLKYVR